MNKTELVEIIASGSEISKNRSELVLNSPLNTIIQALTDNSKVRIDQLGIFIKTNRRGRIGCNPRAGVSLHIPETKSIKFDPSAKVKKS